MTSLCFGDQPRLGFYNLWKRATQGLALVQAGEGAAVLQAVGLLACRPRARVSSRGGGAGQEAGCREAPRREARGLGTSRSASQAQGPAQARLLRPREEQTLPEETPAQPTCLQMSREDTHLLGGSRQGLLKLWSPLADSRGPGRLRTLSRPQLLTRSPLSLQRELLAPLAPSPSGGPGWPAGRDLGLSLCWTAWLKASLWVAVVAQLASGSPALPQAPCS